MAIKPAVYVDSGPLIDAVKFDVGVLDEGRHADAWYLKRLMLAHEAGDIVLYTSMLAVPECVGIEMGQRKVPTDIQERFRSLLLSGRHVRLLTPSPRTAAISQDLRWKHELVIKGADALHIASALEVQCAEFVSTDDRLKSKLKAASDVLRPRLRMIAARETQCLPSHYLQHAMNVVSTDEKREAH